MRVETQARTVGVAMAFSCCRHGGRARGCPATLAVVAATNAAAYDDDLHVRKSTRVDSDDVRTLGSCDRGL